MRHACVIVQCASMNRSRAFAVHFAVLVVIHFFFMKTCNQRLIYICVFLGRLIGK